ncbi:MAG: hypothetical protein QW568_00985 [Candidatus Anstonellaceae archaeon]
MEVQRLSKWYATISAASAATAFTIGFGVATETLTPTNGRSDYAANKHNIPARKLFNSIFPSGIPMICFKNSHCELKNKEVSR